MSTASKLTKLAQGIDSNGVLSAEKGGTGTTSGGAATVVAAAAPVSPQTGSFWLNSDTGDLHVYAGGSWILIGSSGGGFSGSYLDLTDKPTIPTVSPSAISDQPNSSTGYLDLPSGTTAQRPVSAVAGALRLNTETNYLEIYNSTVWVQLQYAGAMIAANYTGATATTDGNYRVLTYNTSGTFTPTSVPIGTTIDYLIVGGGGGGATDMDVGGGGGGGGLLTGTITPTAQTYTITVGAGGAQGTGPDNTGAGGGSNGTQGASSSAFSLTAVGGGYGGTRNQAGGSGGSGGGGGDGGAAGGTGTTGQGYAGGTSPAMNSNSGWDVGGGGGAGGAANSWLPGPGLANSISGTAVTYAAGARGGVAAAATANTGNGGSTRPGGSGVVIIKYRYQ